MISTAELLSIRDETLRAKQIQPHGSGPVVVAFDARLKLLEDLIGISTLNDRSITEMAEIPENIIHVSRETFNRKEAR